GPVALEDPACAPLRAPLAPAARTARRNAQPRPAPRAIRAPGSGVQMAGPRQHPRSPPGGPAAAGSRRAAVRARATARPPGSDHLDRREDLPQPLGHPRRREPRRDRRPLPVRSGLLHRRQRSSLRRPHPPDRRPGLHFAGARQDRRSRLVRRQRGHHERRDDRRALCHRRQRRRHARHPRLLGGGRGARPRGGSQSFARRTPRRADHARRHDDPRRV
ncbi:MAG: COG0110: Acetyltransferase (isoleucine patch superfamily), partial [uncultured Solirubrobacteraceae bacterium]